MRECATNHPALPPLFDPAVPDSPALWAVLLGRHTGRAVVDEVDVPSQCVLRTDATLTYFSPQCTQPFLNEAVAYFSQTDSVWLVWPTSSSANLCGPEGASTVKRLEFFDCDPHSPALAELRRELTPGYEIRRIDRELLKRCEWRAEMEFYCGSIDTFLAHGMGLCLMQGDEIVVEAYVSSFGQGTAEMGATTHAAYRGRGYAPVACAFLIEACSNRGYQAYWSCDADNCASIRVARKLGFRQERAYQILEYNPSF